MKRCDRILERTLRLTDLMEEVAEKGDSAREDVGCGVLYGFLRDSAFKIRRMAEEEKEAHTRKAGAKREGSEAGTAGKGGSSARSAGAKNAGAQARTR